MAKSFFKLFQPAAEEGDALSSPKAVAAWADKLPGNDPMGLVLAMTRLLEELSTRPAPISPGRVQALLALDRMSLGPLGQLQIQYRLPSLSDDVRQQLWHARNDLARWFAYAYEQVYIAIGQQPDRGKYQGLLHRVFSRLVYYRGVQAKQGLVRHDQWIPAKWKFLHKAYKGALEAGVANASFSLIPNAPATENCSPEQEYLHFLLIQRVNTGNLSVLQIDLAAIWLRDWVPALHLVTTPVEGELVWQLDLGLAEGLTTSAAKKSGEPVLYLDVTTVRDRLAETKASVSEQIAQAGSKPEVREL